VGALGYFGFNQYSKGQVDDFILLIGSTNHQEIKSQVTALMETNAGEQQRYFADLRVEAALINYFKSRLESLSKNDEYEKGTPYVEIANKLYIRLAAVSEMIKAFEDSRNQRIAELDGDLATLLSNSDQFLDNYTQLKQIWQTLRKVDRDSKSLQNKEPAILLEDNIAQLIAIGNYDKANELVDFALAVLADEVVFVDYLANIRRTKASIQTSISADQQKVLITGLEDKLLHFDQNSTLSDYQQKLRSIDALEKAHSGSAVLSRVSSWFNTKLATAVDGQIKQQQWDDALTTINKFESIMSQDELEQYKDTVTTAKSAFDDKVSELLRNIAQTSRTTPAKADSILKSLVELGASSAIVDGAKDTVANGWLRQSRKEIAQKNWQKARQAITQGLAMAATEQAKTQLRLGEQSIETAKNQANNQLAEADKQRVSLQKAQNIAALEKQLRQVTQIDKMTIVQATQALKIIDELEVLDNANLLISSAKDKTIELLRVQGLLLANNDLEQALAFGNQAYTLLPASQALAQLVGDVKQRISENKRKKIQQKLDGIEARIVSILGAGDFHENVSELEKLIKSYETNEVDKIASRGLRRKIAEQFVQHAESLKNKDYFTKATQAIEQAKNFDPKLTSIDQTSQAIATARIQYNANKQKIRQQARNESLQTSFMAQVQALDIKSAESKLKQLKEHRDNDAFINQQANKALANALQKLANQAIQKKDFVTAEKWLTKQIGYQSSPAKTQKRLAAVRLANRITVADSSDPIQAREMLAEAKTKYPNEAFISDIILSEVIAASTKEIENKKTDTVAVTTPDPVKPPVTAVTNANACKVSMAGRGKSTRQTCFDFVDGSTKGPRLIVIPKMNGRHFAISRYEITIGDYNVYCKASGNCQPQQGESLLPVTNLDINQMQAYASWLSNVTAGTYQLPSYQQWQFAAKGKASSSKPQYINCKRRSGGKVVRGFKMQKVSYNYKKSRNGWGFTHYLGNAQEVVKDGASWQAVGGGWEDEAKKCTVDSRKNITNDIDADIRKYTGFRLVRTL
ncbi:MAG: SUMF1/EgtB/PvdO family nonheme iron enzyme, partial [Algicola sp.]|nr:SUMF1/EgtB/PvdO family nonheme iron enzyme [Algicola sp.]